MRGMAISGSGEGKKFISMEEYKKQIIEKTNIEPYLGTLNLKVEKSLIDDLKKVEGILIKGFSKDGITYGNVKCFLIDIRKIDAAVLLPEKSKYRDVVEIIASESLRKKLAIKDGDSVEFQFKPFIKEEKLSLYAKPFIGGKEGNVTIYYDSPFIEGRRDLCYFRKNKNSYRKSLYSKNIASIIFEDNEKDAYEKLMKWIKERGYAIMSPVRKVRYKKLNEWQMEVKISRN